MSGLSYRASVTVYACLFALTHRLSCEIYGIQMIAVCPLLIALSMFAVGELMSQMGGGGGMPGGMDPAAMQKMMKQMGGGGMGGLAGLMGGKGGRGGRRR